MAILKLTSLKINRLLPMATINMHMKFEIEMIKETWLMLRKPCRLQTDGRTDGWMDGRTDGQGESSIPPPPTSLGGGIIIFFNKSTCCLGSQCEYISIHNRQNMFIYFYVHITLWLPEVLEKLLSKLSAWVCKSVTYLTLGHPDKTTCVVWYILCCNLWLIGPCGMWW